MELLSEILSRVLEVGAILLIVIFQPEIRRFLILLGKSLLKGQNSILSFLVNKEVSSGMLDDSISEIMNSLENLQSTKTGALIVLTKDEFNPIFLNSGTEIDAKISQPLLESIFNKYSPLHDGAMVIKNDKILKASCILPVSKSQKLSANLGTRHRAAVGVTEDADEISIIVSEENGAFSYSMNGQLSYSVDSNEILNVLKSYFGNH